MQVSSVLFVCYMNEAGWRVLRVVLFLQMTTTLPLRLRHQNYPRRCTYEVFPKWQRLNGENEKQYWKPWIKFSAWFNFRHKFVCLFLQSFKHTEHTCGVRPTEQFRLIGYGLFIELFSCVCIYLIFCLLLFLNMFAVVSVLMSSFNVSESLYMLQNRIHLSLGQMFCLYFLI